MGEVRQNKCELCLGCQIEFDVSSIPQNISAPPSSNISLFSSLYILNILDCLFSVYYLHFWKVEEDNPLLQWAFQKSPLFFVLVKMGLVVFSIEVFRRTLTKGLFKNLTLVLLNVIYLSVFLWHLFGFYLIFFELGA